MGTDGILNIASAFLSRKLDYSLTHKERELLKAHIGAAIDTGTDEQRAWAAIYWLFRTEYNMDRDDIESLFARNRDALKAHLREQQRIKFGENPK